MTNDFNRYAEKYDARAAVQTYFAKQLLSHLPDWKTPQRILDVGAGTGILSRLLPQHDFTNMDNAERMLAQCPKEDTRLLADVNAFPELEETYDVVMSNFALHWAYDPEYVWAEMRRCLKPGGTYAIAFPIVGSLPELGWVIGAERMHVFPDAMLQHSTDSLNHIVPHQMFYPCLHDVLYAIKGVGGAYKERRKSFKLLTKSRLQLWEENYRAHYGSEEGFPLSWRVQVIIGQVP